MARSLQQKARNVTVLGSETQFSGIMQFKDELVITGKFDGTIEALGNLEIDKKAQCSVDSIQANSIIVSGQVTGNLTAQDRVEMKSGSRIIGNVTACKLRIEDNVDFQGRVTMLDAVEEYDLFAMTSTDYKDLLLASKNN